MLTGNIWIYDFEVFALDWLVVFKRVSDGCYQVFHNDGDGVCAFMKEEQPVLTGYNIKHYDNWILKAVLSGCEPGEVKTVNDLIILQSVPGFSIPFLKNCGIYFPSFDLMDDMQQGLSLKAIEAHLEMDIEETKVDFNLDRALTEAELEQTIRYCKYDVDATEKLFHLRKDYLENKAILGQSCGLSEADALYMTNAKLTSVYLEARRPEVFWNDERNYQYPQQLLLEYIPAEVKAFFDRLHDESVDLDEIMSDKLDITVGECPVTIGWGGIHGAIPNYVEEAAEGRSIRNKDVASYYPNLIRRMGYASRAMKDPGMYAEIIDRRVAAKKAGDKATANALKLVLNTTYGGMLNGHGDQAFNDLYDPLMARSVCISGQLFLLELTEHLIRECPSLKVIQLNTDGIMVSFDDADEPKWQEITSEWESRTGFELEEDFIRKIVQKDVNNYVEVPVDEKKDPKVKGGVLVRGIAPAGAFNINNNAVVVAEAVKRYFVDGTDPEETIGKCERVLDFQLIAKESSKYSEVYHETFAGMMAAQRCNRVYASKDLNLGTLVKKHRETGKLAKIAGLPKHCVVDNQNRLDISAVDKDWYVSQARKYIRNFLGDVRKADMRKINTLKKKALGLFDEVGQKELF